MCMRYANGGESRVSEKKEKTWLEQFVFFETIFTLNTGLPFFSERALHNHTGMYFSVLNYQYSTKSQSYEVL